MAAEVAVRWRNLSVRESNRTFLSTESSLIVLSAVATTCIGMKKSKIR